MKGLPSRWTRAHTDENPLWLIVLCDLMTNLMLFFLVMYSFVLQTPTKRVEWLKTFEAAQLVETPQAKADAVINEFKERESAAALVQLVRNSSLSSLADVEVTERTIRVSLRSHLLFGTAQADLKEDTNRTLGLLVLVLKEIPNDVIVEGHTDDVPITAGPYRTNWELSVGRSSSVIDQLIREGIPPARLIAAGYGPYHPLAPNATAEGRARNRRVEIVILRNTRAANEAE